MKRRKRIIAILVVIMILFMVLFFMNYNKHNKMKKLFSEIHGDLNVCAYERKYHSISFENHSIDLDDVITNAVFCGGIDLIEDELFFTIIDKDYNFKIVKSDYFLNNQQVIYEKRYSYMVEAKSYGHIIYFGEPRNRDVSKVEAFSLITNEYLGVLSQQIAFSYSDYVSDMKQKNICPYVFDCKPSFFDLYSVVDVTNSKSQKTKRIDKDKLMNSNVGMRIVELKRYFWSNIYWINDKIYLICSIVINDFSLFSPKYNLVFEYDFDLDTLNFIFHFPSNEYDCIELYFGYE